MPAAPDYAADPRRLAIRTDGLLGLFVRLSAPALLVTILHGLTVLIDIVYAGHLIGTDAVAALGVVHTLNHIVFSFEALVATGAAAALSIAIGRGDRSAEHAIFTAVLLLSLLVSGVLIAAGTLLAPPALGFLGLRDNTLAMGWSYYRLYLAGSFFVIYAFCTGALLQARGDIVRMTVNHAAGIATTAIVTPLLIGPAGIGLAGAAGGTVTGAVVTAALNTAVLRRGRHLAGLVRPSRALIARVLSVGQSGMLIQMSYFVQGFLVFRTLAETGTEADLAFMGATYRVVLFGVYIATGFSRALQPVAGINYGAGDGRRVARAFLVFNAGALAVVAGPWLVSMASPSMILGLIAPGLSVSAQDAAHFRTYVSIVILVPFLLTSLTLYQAVGLQWQVTALGLVRLVVLFVPAILLMPMWFGIAGGVLCARVDGRRADVDPGRQHRGRRSPATGPRRDGAYGARTRNGILNTWLYAPLIIITPAIIGGVLHSLAIRMGVLKGLAVPVSERWFGRHKTYRGFVVMPLACVIGVYLAAWLEQQLPPAYWVGFSELSIWLEGLALGLAYVAFELPNSFAKRRFGIKEGTLGEGRARWLFLFADQVDSVIGCVLVCAIFFDVPTTVLVATVVVGVAGHMATNLTLYVAGVRRRPV